MINTYLYFPLDPKKMCFNIIRRICLICMLVMLRHCSSSWGIRCQLKENQFKFKSNEISPDAFKILTDWRLSQTSLTIQPKSISVSKFKIRHRYLIEEFLGIIDSRGSQCCPPCFVCLSNKLQTIVKRCT